MNEVYEKYYNKIYVWAIGKTHNREDAFDITSSTFVAMFEYLNKNISIKKCENLIWKIAYNIWCTKAKEYIKEKNNKEVEEVFVATSENMLDKIVYKEIVDNLENFKLSEKELYSFRNYYINDLSVKKISNMLDTSESNVKYYLFNARKKIKEAYND